MVFVVCSGSTIARKRFDNKEVTTMKYLWRVVCALMLCSTLAGCAFFSSSGPSQQEMVAEKSTGVPTAVVPETNFKVKQVPEQKISQDTGEVFRIAHDFMIRNTGTGDLKILAIKPG